MGLPLLYASAYFLALLTATGAYLLPSRDLYRWQQQVSRHELLLVVSTDHWFRNRWYQANQVEALTSDRIAWRNIKVPALRSKADL
jgi:hypothetical protein